MLRGLLFIPFLVLSISSLAQEPDSIRIKSIYFGGGSYYIDEVQMVELQDFLNEIVDPSKYTISITSHTDNIGGAEYNQWLSRMRSEAVIQQLLMRAIERERIKVENKGLADPLYDNESWLGRRANRRVDILFTPIML